MTDGSDVAPSVARPRRIEWRAATVRDVIRETAHAKTLVMDVADWPGHTAGQHVDVRLTAEDGYQAQRSYSIASAQHARALRSPLSGWTTARCHRI